MTLQHPPGAVDAGAASVRNERYLDAVRRAGGEPMPIDESSSQEARTRVFAEMDGLLLTGGADLDPALYGAPRDGTENVEPGRDRLELLAWEAARARRVPVLGICRGFQAINVFSGGRLVQHVEGHRPAGRDGPPVLHSLRLQPGSRFARILRPTGSAGVLQVNSYHHQAVRREDLAPGLAVAGTSRHARGELVEAFESTADRLILGIQCHPERTESTPPEFARVWTVFVDAARYGPLRDETTGSS